MFKLSFLAVYSVTSTSADICEDFCTRELGKQPCSKKTFCKDNGACHALMWSGRDQPLVCIYGIDRSCKDDMPVRCDEARREIGLPRAELRPVVMDPHFVREYNTLFSRCKEYLVPRDPRTILDPYDLVKAKAEAVVEGIGSLHVNGELGQGMYGKALSFAESDSILLKGAKSDHGRDDLCWERSILRVLNGLDGRVPREYKVTWLSEPFHLPYKNRVIVMDRVGDMEWGDMKHRLDENFLRRIVKLLENLRDVHGRGFLHYDIKGANIRINSKDPNQVFLVDFGQGRPFIDDQGRHLLEPNPSRKDDLRNVRNLIEDSLPKGTDLNVFDDFFRRVSALEHTTTPDYAALIDSISRIVLPRAVARPGRINPQYVREYNELFARCKEYLVPRDPRTVLDPYDLVKAKAETVIEGIGSVHVNAELGQGMYGKALSFAETNRVLLKGAKSGHGRDDLCWERSILRVLNGLEGGVPREYKVIWLTEPYHLLFKNRVIVMDRVGDMEWGDMKHRLDRNFITRLIKLLETLREVHNRGFLHYDIKGANIRVQSNDPNQVYLVDFGQGKPFIDEEGRHLPESHPSRKDDLRNVQQMIKDSLPKGTDLTRFDEFFKQISALKHSSTPDYEAMIATVTKIA